MEQYEKYFDEYELTEEDVISNFDHQIDYDVAEKLKTGKYVSGYPALGYHAKVIYCDGEYIARIKRYQSIQGYVKSKSINGLMELCCDEYGYE